MNEALCWLKEINFTKDLYCYRFKSQQLWWATSVILSTQLLVTLTFTKLTIVMRWSPCLAQNIAGLRVFMGSMGFLEFLCSAFIIWQCVGCGVCQLSSHLPLGDWLPYIKKCSCNNTSNIIFAISRPLVDKSAVEHPESTSKPNRPIQH